MKSGSGLLGLLPDFSWLIFLCSLDTIEEGKSSLCVILKAE